MLRAKWSRGQSAAQTTPRAMALDILPSIGFDYHEIFIKAIEDEAIHWSIFLRPLSLEVWIALIGVALVISDESSLSIQQR